MLPPSAEIGPLHSHSLSRLTTTHFRIEPRTSPRFTRSSKLYAASEARSTLQENEPERLRTISTCASPSNAIGHMRSSGPVGLRGGGVLHKMNSQNAIRPS